jgi:hypothetical protein
MKKENLIKREDGSQIKIVCSLFTNINQTHSIDTFVLFRENAEDNWNVLSNIPAEGFKAMPREEYIRRGRSPLIQKVRVGELLKALNEFRKDVIDKFGITAEFSPA